MSKNAPEVKPMKAITTRDLPVPLTKDEQDLKAQEMATAERLLAEAEAAETTAAEEWKQEKKALENETQTRRAKLSLIGRIVREKREFRPVEIVESPNPGAKTVDTVRTDTGEIIETRGMNPRELQSSLFALNAKPLDAVGDNAQA